MNRLYSVILSILFFLISFAPPIAAQNDFEEFVKKNRSEYNQYLKSVKSEFEAYREKCNREFAEFLSERWEQFDVEKPVVNEKPEPPEPVYAPVEDVTEDKPSVEVPVADIVDNKIPEYNKPVNFPIDVPVEDNNAEQAENPLYSISFYGEKPGFSYDKNTMKLSLKGIDEKNVSSAWTFLSSKDYDMVIHECLSFAKEYKLDDWGLFRLVGNFAEDTHGKETDESYVVMAYMMSQLGYDARIYRMGNRLGVMIPVGPDIAERPYLELSGRSYYTFGPSGSEGIYTYNSAFEGATRSLNLYRKYTPVVGTSYVTSKTVASKKFPELSCSTEINSMLMDYYNDIPPVLDYTYYVQQPCDSKTMDAVYSALRSAISGKDEIQSINMILDFVQQGFEYETDDKQFGHEKYNFPEETFYYKACDCDDRAILFAALVRNLSGLDVVLIEYPNHLATAVRFNGQIKGDYVTLNGAKYYICDPTYIGASAGMAMPSVDSSKIKVYQIAR